MTESTPRTNHVVSFINIGTNSIRMLIVRLNPNFSYTVISQEKEVVRLGEREFADSQLQPEAMDRAVLVCKKFAELSRTYGADEIIAVATSAAREARNQASLIDRLRDEAGIEVGVISGMEEARLVYLGVSSGAELSSRTALFIDIGGGGTEMAIGDRNEYTYLDSLKLGAIRLTSMFIKEGSKGPVRPRHLLKDEETCKIAHRAQHPIPERYQGGDWRSAVRVPSSTWRRIFHPCVWVREQGPYLKVFQPEETDPDAVLAPARGKTEGSRNEP